MKQPESRTALTAFFLRRLLPAVLIAVLMASRAPAEDLAGSAASAVTPSLPKWTLVPRTSQSVPLGTVVLGDNAALKQAPKDNAVALDRFGYVEEEYFISGAANLYAKDGTAVAKADVPYTTRIIVRRPADPSRFSGTVQLEPMDGPIESARSWSWAWPYLVSNHDVWVGVTVSKDDIGALHKKIDAARYAPLDISDDGQRWDILAQLAWAMRSPDGPLDKLGFLDQAAIVPGLLRVYVSGWSQAGCVAAEFLNKGRHQQARRPDGRPLIDGYIVGTCPTSGPLAVPNDAAVIQVMTESEYGGDAGMRDAVVASRRPDGNKAGEHRYRWYDVAGVADAGYLDQPALSLTAYQAALAKDTECAKPVSRVSGMADIARAMFRNLDEWVRIGRYPPHGAAFQLGDDHAMRRDQYGNVLGGLRPYWVDVPSFKFVLGSGETTLSCTHAGYEEPLPQDTFAKLYKGRDAYVEKVTDAVILLVNGRFMLAADADALLAGLRDPKARQAALAKGG